MSVHDYTQGTMNKVLDLHSLRRVHFIGIGGAGLSAIARVLIEKGFDVSGSDLQANALTEQLHHLGARTFVGHLARQIDGADLVVVSSAVPPDNEEWQEAARLGIPVVKRGPLLAALLTEAPGTLGIAVAGSHGKTTTAGMIAWVLSEAGQDPTFIIGGVLRNFGTNARAGSGPCVVLEADEYDRTFLALAPHIAVLTSIEMDHPDCYRDETDMANTFAQFAARAAPEGLIVAFGDDRSVAGVARDASDRTGVIAETFGFLDGCTWHAESLMRQASGSTFAVAKDGAQVATVHLLLPGDHNVLNALAALAVVSHLGITPAEAARSLGRFEGTLRRMEIRGTFDGVTVIDDYAHHPTQIAATLNAVRQQYGERQIWAVFQPHTYSRLKALWRGFAACFGGADHVIVLPVYAARERPDPSVQPKELAREIDHPDVRFAAGLSEAASLLADAVRPGDIVITLGAGDEWAVGDELLHCLASDLAQTLHVED